MIRYTLKCAADHSFESWFQSAAAFDSLKATGLVACPVCDTDQVEKALMAPQVSLGERPQSETAQSEGAQSKGAQTERALSVPRTKREVALAQLRRKIEENSEYVGVNFVAEARKMHEGEAPERSIYGEARPEEAIKLLEDGVPVAPLPFMPGRKTN